MKRHVGVNTRPGRVPNAQVPCLQGASPSWYIDVCYQPGISREPWHPEVLPGFYCVGVID